MHIIIVIAITTHQFNYLKSVFKSVRNRKRKGKEKKIALTQVWLTPAPDHDCVDVLRYRLVPDALLAPKGGWVSGRGRLKVDPYPIARAIPAHCSQSTSRKNLSRQGGGGTYCGRGKTSSRRHDVGADVTPEARSKSLRRGAEARTAGCSTSRKLPENSRSTPTSEFVAGKPSVATHGLSSYHTHARQTRHQHVVSTGHQRSGQTLLPRQARSLPEEHQDREHNGKAEESGQEGVRRCGGGGDQRGHTHPLAANQTQASLRQPQQEYQRQDPLHRIAENKEVARKKQEMAPEGVPVTAGGTPWNPSSSRTPQRTIDHPPSPVLPASTAAHADSGDKCACPVCYQGMDHWGSADRLRHVDLCLLRRPRSSSSPSHKRSPAGTSLRGPSSTGSADHVRPQSAGERSS
ncbi:unnamed protein product, partial [Discosporangium mesarthrocarpum]